MGIDFLTLGKSKKFVKKTLEGAGALKGDKGDKGNDGITPHIGENGNWFIGDTDTGAKASGISADEILHIGSESDSTTAPFWIDEDEEDDELIDLDGQINKGMSNYLNEYRPIFDTFPTDEELSKLQNNTVFETKGFYSINDGAGCKYIYTKTWKDSCIRKGVYYIKPLNQMRGEVFLPYYGIRTGYEYAESNSEILATLLGNIAYSSLLKLPSGHFYFSETINLATNQHSLTGAVIPSFHTDKTAFGATWIHFPNLTDDGVGIRISIGSLSNVNIYGNPNSYNCTLDRTYTYTAPDSIVQEVSTIKAYGVKGGSTSEINNVSVMYFYYGMYFNTGNIYITDVNFRKCHYGLSIGNDTKVKGVYGFDIMTLLQIRGSISSASQVRGDSIGNHLVEIIGGSQIYLSDLDADYCMNSLLHIGNSAYTTHNRLVISGIHGRCNVYHAYDKTTDDAPTAHDVTKDNYQEYGLITIAPKTVVAGLTIIAQGIASANPLDATSNYLTPNIILCMGLESTLKGAHFILSEFSIELTQEWIENRVKVLSINSNNTELAITSAKGTMYYKRSGSTASFDVSATSTYIKDYVDSYDISKKVDTYLDENPIETVYEDSKNIFSVDKVYTTPALTTEFPSDELEIVGNGNRLSINGQLSSNKNLFFGTFDIKASTTYTIMCKYVNGNHVTSGVEYSALPNLQLNMVAKGQWTSLITNLSLGSSNTFKCATFTLESDVNATIMCYVQKTIAFNNMEIDVMIAEGEYTSADDMQTYGKVIKSSVVDMLQCQMAANISDVSKSVVDAETEMLKWELENAEKKNTQLSKLNDFTWGNFDKAYFCFVCDDCNSYLPAIYDLFHEKGIPLSSATITSTLGTTYSGETRTIKDILNLIVADGGEILAHYNGNLADEGYSDGIHEFLTDESDWLSKTRDVKKVLEENGFEVRGIIRADYTQENSETGEKICRKYFDYADGLGISTQYNLKRTFFHNYTDLDSLKAKIDTQASTAGFYPYCFHGTETLASIENLTEIIDYILAKGDSVKFSTYANIYDNIGTTILVKKNEINDKISAYLGESEVIQSLEKSKTEWINVKTCGAVGDGITDDAEAIQKAIDSIGNYEEGTIYFPVGRYRITKGLTIGVNNNQQSVHLVGACRANKDNSNSKYNSDGTTTPNTMVSQIYFDAPTNTVDEITLLTVSGKTTNSYCTIKNLCFAGNSFSDFADGEVQSGTEIIESYTYTIADYIQNGIVIDNVNRKFCHCQVDDCSFSGFSGIAFSGGLGTRYSNLFASYCKTAILGATDSIFDNVYITMCDKGFDLSEVNGTVSLYNFWIDLIKTYAIYSSAPVQGNIIGHVDHIGLSGIYTSKLQFANVILKATRCGGNYRNVDLNNASETDIAKASVIGASYSVENNTIQIAIDTSKEWIGSGNDTCASSQVGVTGVYLLNNNAITMSSAFSHADVYSKSSENNTITVAGRNNEIEELRSRIAALESASATT